MQITIDLTDEQSSRLDELARPLGLSPEQLARAAFSDLLATPAVEFERAMRHVLDKNRELYERC